MATTYKKYQKLNIDSSRIGLGRGECESTYFCTPDGAEIIGWGGVDGIHYCFVRGFGEMVFAVSPMNTPGNYVHPVARDFMDFLRLLLACGDAAALEQVYSWEQAQFDAFLQDNPFAVEQQVVLDTIREKLVITPMEQPFAYIKELQNGFDYRLIPYTADYYDMVAVEPPIPEWKVYFDADFWGRCGRGRAGKEIPLNKQFLWGDEVWTIPAIYPCGKGLIVDFCLQVPPERIRAFLERWNLSGNDDGAKNTLERRMRMDAENPLVARVNPKVILNGTELSSCHGCGFCWNPCFPEGNGLEAWSVMRHYGLDPEQGYAVWRGAFHWKTKRKPQIKTLSAILMQEPVAIPGPHFRASSPGEQIELIHPSTGMKHILTVQEYEQQELPAERFNNPDLEFPGRFARMVYTLSPDLPDQAFMVADCARGDRPRQKRADPRAPQATGDCCVGVIGGADGPTAIFLGGSGQGKLCTACSSLHFEPVDNVEWRMVFYDKSRQDITVELI